MDYEFLVNDTIHKLSVDRKDSRYIVSDGDRKYEADMKVLSPGVISILIGEKSFQLYLANDGKKRYVYLNGQHMIVQEPIEDQESFKGGGGQSEEDMFRVKAPMPGKVIKINVEEKEEIRKNQTLAIVEAMKMENEIKSSIDGIVKTIFISTGDLVDSDKPLMELGFKD